MMGYGEIRYDSESSFYGWMSQNTSAPSSLQSVFNQITHERLLSVMISNKEEVYQALQKFLQPREDSHV